MNKQTSKQINKWINKNNKYIKNSFNKPGTTIDYSDKITILTIDNDHFKAVNSCFYHHSKILHSFYSYF